MVQFNIIKIGTLPVQASGPKLTIHEGSYSNGRFHLVQTDLRQFRAHLGISPEFADAGFVSGHDQAFIQGRMEKGPEIDKMRGRHAEFMAAGKKEFEAFLNQHPEFVLISDATNSPWNEGHFAVHGGKILPLPKGSHPVSGKHYVLQIKDGKISFGLLDTDNAKAARDVEYAIFVPKVVHEGRPIRLLDEVPGTGRIAISDHRGHIGQIFQENSYSERGSEKRASMHTELIALLRDPRAYIDVLRNIIRGLPFNFNRYGEIALPLNTYNHTLWVETEDGKVFLVKTYPRPGLKDSSGISFDNIPEFLFELGRAYGFTVRNAYIGTNGKDVRVIVPGRNGPAAITNSLTGDPLGDYFEKPLTSFIAFT